MTAEQAREKAHRLIKRCRGGTGYGPGGDGPRRHTEACEALTAAILAERDAALEEAQKIAADFPADVHGSLPVTPSRIASQVKDEIAAAIRSLKGTP